LAATKRALWSALESGLTITRRRCAAEPMTEELR
jgi:hypothetical protein